MMADKMLKMVEIEAEIGHRSDVRSTLLARFVLRQNGTKECEKSRQQCGVANVSRRQRRRRKSRTK